MFVALSMTLSRQCTYITLLSASEEAAAIEYAAGHDMHSLDPATAAASDQQFIIIPAIISFHHMPRDMQYIHL
jgi:hypothetical protein